MPVSFSFVEIQKFPFSESFFRKWILAIIKEEEKKAGNIAYVFVNDDFLLDLNEKFLDHDTLTDIITFDYSNDSVRLSGDVYISIERVIENSSLFESGFSNELARVIAHGILHLCGYSDKNEIEIAAMRMKEDYYIKKLNLEQL